MTTSDYPVLCVWVNAPLINEPGGSPTFCLKLLSRFGYKTNFVALHKTQKTQKVDAGRNDVFFTIHKSDIAKFSVARFKLFSIETGFIYGIIYKNRDLRAQVEFFKQNGISSFTITDEFEKFALFKVKIFDKANEAEAEQEIEKFLSASKQHLEAFPECTPLKTFDPGFIRWWEDIVNNGASDCYSQEVLEKFPTDWKNQFKK